MEKMGFLRFWRRLKYDLNKGSVQVVLSNENDENDNRMMMMMTTTTTTTGGL